MDIIEFHRSTSKELLAIKDRVRNLIYHWGEDGRHQEAVIKMMIQRFLPEKYRIGTGFVVEKANYQRNHSASKQIDLIIYDISYPILFKENDFVILTADSVVGIIEVKANAVRQRLRPILNQCNDNGKFIYNASPNRNKPLFNGIFSYESKVINSQTIANAINDSFNRINHPDKNEFCVNHVSFNETWFYKFWGETFEPHKLYEINELSFSFFISNLMDWIGGNSVIENSNLWFPIDKSIQVKKRF